MDAVAPVTQASSAWPCFESRGDHTGAERFGEDQNVAGARTHISPDSLRMDYSGHRVTKLQFVVANGMSADHGAIRFCHFRQTAAQNLFQHFRRASCGKGQDGERGNRTTAHGIHIAERIGSGHLAEKLGIIEDRREKVHGLHDGEIVGEAIDSCIVAGFKTNDDVRINLW